MKKCLLIWEQGVRPARNRRLVLFWAQALREADVEVESVRAEDAADARRLARNAGGWEAVAVAGTDALLHAVMDGLAAISDGERPRLGFLPVDARSEFCRIHHLPTAPASAVQNLIQGATRSFDLASIRYRDEDGREQASVCTSRCSVGPAVHVVRCVEAWRTRLGERLGMSAALLWNCITCRRIDLEVMIDGETISLPNVNLFCVLKGPFLAPGVTVDAGVEADDGRIAVVAVQQLGRCGLLALTPRLLAGTAAQSADLCCRLCRSVLIRSETPCRIEVDGVLQGWLPASVDVLPPRLELICPAGI